MAILISAVIVLVAMSGFIFFWLLKRPKSPSVQKTNQAAALISKDIQAQILIESITDGIIVSDTDGRVTLFNNGASKLTGWPIEEAMGMDARVILRLLENEKSTEAITNNQHPITKVLQKREPLQNTLQLINRSNQRLFVSLVISPVIVPKNNELMGTVAVFRNVTAEKGEEQRRAEFISTASHEMRTPVAAIEGYLALALNDKVSTIDSKAREYLEKAHSSTQHLGKLFQDLLTSAKAEDGRLTSHPTIVEMGSYVEQLTEDLRFSAEKKGLEVEYIVNTHITTETGAIDTSAGGKSIQPLYYANVDPDRIREVITNVFDNAVKYTEQGRISIGLTGNNEVTQIRITDTGPGIPASDIPHLFQKFYRVDNTATRAIGGTGLGLFICRKIVELYNGIIWAESTLGKGTTFYINFPRIDTNRATKMQNDKKAITTT